MPTQAIGWWTTFFPQFYFSESLSLLQADIDQCKRSVYTSLRNRSYEAATKRRVQTESQYVNDNATDPIINQPDVTCIAISISPMHGQARTLVQKMWFYVREWQRKRLEMRVRRKCDDRFMLKITFQLNARGPVDDTKTRLPDLHNTMTVAGRSLYSNVTSMAKYGVSLFKTTKWILVYVSEKGNMQTVAFLLVMCLPATGSGSRKLTDCPWAHFNVWKWPRAYAINQRPRSCSLLSFSH